MHVSDASIKAIGMLARCRPMSGPQVDQNLLLGMLALRKDFISADALKVAINARALEES
jgi:hypothetical protein